MCSESKWDFSDLKALFLNCTLKKSPELSHTQGLIDICSATMEKNEISVEVLRPVDFNLAFGVYPDMTKQGWDIDDWPQIYEKVKAAHILVITSPIWLGEKSSVCTQTIERLYSSSGDLNDRDQSDTGRSSPIRSHQLRRPVGGHSHTPTLVEERGHLPRIHPQEDRERAGVREEEQLEGVVRRGRGRVNQHRRGPRWGSRPQAGAQGRVANDVVAELSRVREGGPPESRGLGLERLGRDRRAAVDVEQHATHQTVRRLLYRGCVINRGAVAPILLLGERPGST